MYNMTNKFVKPPKKVSERMKRVKSRGTKLESEMESILRSIPLKYEIQPKIFGHPDFRLKEKNVLIFCDSSFWHGKRSKEISGKAFRRNKDFWVKKLTENRKRDVRITRTLRSRGWSVYRFSDIDIIRKSDKVKNILKRL